jgi:hypothetical protein
MNKAELLQEFVGDGSSLFVPSGFEGMLYGSIGTLPTLMLTTVFPFREDRCGIFS